MKGSTTRITPPSDTRESDRRARPFVRSPLGSPPDLRWFGTGGHDQAQSPMWSLRHVVRDVRLEHSLEVPMTVDQDVVEALATHSPHEPLGECIRPRCADRRSDDANALATTGSTQEISNHQLTLSSKRSAVHLAFGVRHDAFIVCGSHAVGRPAGRPKPPRRIVFGHAQCPPCCRSVRSAHSIQDLPGRRSRGGPPIGDLRAGRVINLWEASLAHPWPGSGQRRGPGRSSRPWRVLGLAERAAVPKGHLAATTQPRIAMPTATSTSHKTSGPWPKPT